MSQTIDCPNCQESNRVTARFCSRCGANLVSGAPVHSANPPIMGQGKNHTMSSLASKLISPMGLTILVCFFLPWLTVSCGNMAILNNVSGFEMAQGISIQGQRSESAPILYIVAAAGVVMGLAGLGLWATRNPAASVVALISAVAVLALWFLFRTRVTEEFAQAARQGMVFDIRWEIGFWGTFIGGAVGALSSLISFGERDS